MSNLYYYRPDWVQPTDEHLHVDICVYGASSAGVTAAIESVARGHSVVLLQPGKFDGGLTTGGLGWTDYGRKNVIGGLARDFYRRVGRHYGKDEEFQFEPSVASRVYQEMLSEAGISVRLCQYLDRVQMDGGRIAAIALLGGLRVSAKFFIDASYEGDLLAKAGVAYTVGRESNDTYGETLNGIQVRNKHQFSHAVDPYVRPGDPASGLLPGVVGEDLSLRVGQGDKRVQAYCFRMCMTDDPALKIDWQKPDNYDPMQYVLAGRWYAGPKDESNEQVHAHDPTTPSKFDILPNKTPGGYHKTDTNNHSAVSSDYIGANYDWPDGCYEMRERIFQAHVTYQQGFYWYMANSPDVPQRYRDAYRRWGLPSDEFSDTGHWPHQLYIREARRMAGDYVIVEADCRGQRRADDSIGMGSYGMDSHNCSRFVAPDAATGKPRVINEGDVQVGGFPPYPISYRCIVPARGQCQNLLVPICLSSSHIAYGSARMEPVFMVLGQSAALAASLALRTGTSVQEVKYGQLRPLLEDARQILEL